MRHQHLLFESLIACSLALVVGACSSSTQNGDAANDASNNDATGNDTVATDTTSTDVQPIDTGIGPDATDTNPSDVTPTDTMPPGDSGPADGFGAGCNMLTLTGAPITPDCPTGTAPTGTGGTIALGTYDLTAAHAYNATTVCSILAGMTLAATAQLTSTTLDLVAQTSMGTSRGEGTWTTSGTNFLLTPTCPMSTMTSSQSYTATATTLHLYVVNGAITVDEVFTLR